MPPLRLLAAGVGALVLLSASAGADDRVRAGRPAVDAGAPTAVDGTVPPGAGPGHAVSEDADAEGTPPLSQRCESPAGFTIAYPEGWSTDDGETVPSCTRFAPGTFSVPAGTDARVGAVTARVRMNSFDRIVSSDIPPVLDRTDLTVDERTAARIERESIGQGLYPAGVRITSYVVDLEPGSEGPRTLVVDTLELPPFDYASNTEILDRMMETIEVARG